MASDFSLSRRELAVAADAQLVLMAGTGCREAFDEIDRRYRDRIRRYLQRHANGWSHADDLTQQTLIRAFEVIDQLRFGDRLGAWLYRIAYRLLIDHSRKKHFQHRTLETEPVDCSRVTVDSMIAEEEKNDIWQIARRTLSHDEFVAVELHYAENFNIAEIAEIMSRSRVSVRVLLHRARNRLLPTLADFLEEPS